MLGDSIDPSRFVSQDAKLVSDGTPLSDINVSKIVKIGADVLGVRMDLNRPVRISISANPQTEYRVLASEDGLSWSVVGSGGTYVSDGSGSVAFETDHFSYFALTLPPAAPTCTITATPAQVTNGAQSTLNWSSQNSVSASLSGIGSQPVQGSLAVTPAMNASTTYVLSVLGNRSGTGTCQVSVVAVSG